MEGNQHIPPNYLHIIFLGSSPKLRAGHTGHSRRQQPACAIITSYVSALFSWISLDQNPTLIHSVNPVAENSVVVCNRHCGAHGRVMFRPPIPTMGGGADGG